MSYFSEDKGRLLLHCHIQPNASRTEIAGLHGERLKIRLAAPPVEGKANDALVRFLAGRLGVPGSAVSIVRGQSGRRKTVRIEQQVMLPDDFPSAATP
jgi:hypothetical protein